MGEDYAYEQIMGMSGAAYRVCFVAGWDWSCTDALVSFDFATPLYDAIGYTPIWGKWTDPNEREAERRAIVRDLRAGKPVLAINLRIAPEFGVIAGYLDDGGEFLVRTYFDKSVFDEWERGEEPKPGLKEKTFTERGGYLANDADFWPFIITRFGDRKDKPSPLEILRTSLATLVKSFEAGPRDHYYNGRQAYERWMQALSEDADFALDADRNAAIKRLGVNDRMMFHLVDARRAAERYLRESAPLLPEGERAALWKIADHCGAIHRAMAEFRDKQKFCPDTGQADNPANAIGVADPALRREQIALLRRLLKLEEENVEIVKTTWPLPMEAAAPKIEPPEKRDSLF